jgi:Zn-dependent protease
MDSLDGVHLNAVVEILHAAGRFRSLGVRVHLRVAVASQNTGQLRTLLLLRHGVLLNFALHVLLALGELVKRAQESATYGASFGVGSDCHELLGLCSIVPVSRLDGDIWFEEVVNKPVSSILVEGAHALAHKVIKHVRQLRVVALVFGGF